MSITPLSGQTPYTTQPPASPESVWHSVLSAASSTLGVSTSSLQAEVARGQSLSAIAAAQGVSSDTLLKSIETALQHNPRLAGASTSQIDKIAHAIAHRAAGTREHHGPHHHRGGVDAPAAGGAPSSNGTDAPRGDGTPVVSSSTGETSSSARFDTFA